MDHDDQREPESKNVLKDTFATAPTVLLLKYDTERKGDNFILFTFLETGAEAVTAAKSRVLA